MCIVHQDIITVNYQFKTIDELSPTLDNIRRYGNNIIL